jgi:quercetin dioxygenase-like cupin family protein
MTEPLSAFPSDPSPADALDASTEYALGLSGAELVAHLTETDLDAGRELAALGAIGAILAPGSELPQPRPWVRARLLERIRQEQFQFVRRHEGAWVPLPATPGGHAKTLYAGPHLGEVTRLLRLPIADTLPELAEASDPAIVVVDGELWGDGESFGPGEIVQPAGAESAVRSWRTPGCTVLLVERGTPSATPRARRRLPRLHVDAPGWRPLTPGTEVLPVAAGRDEETDVMLLRMAAGGVLPDHEHAGVEEIFLLRGSCDCEGTRLVAGDYHRAAGGSEHHETTTDEGCLMLVVLRKAA